MGNMQRREKIVKQKDQRTDHPQGRMTKTYFGYRDHTIADDNVPVPLIRFYAVTTAKDHDTTIDLSKTGITVYRDKGYFGHDTKGINGTMDEE